MVFDAYLTVAAAAHRLGVSERTVYAWIEAGKITPDPAMKKWKRTLIPDSEVLRFEKERDDASG